MIKYLIIFLFSVSFLNAQTYINEASVKVRVGDLFKIGKPKASAYKHIDFPKANFIIKKGGIANYKNTEGELVVVTAIKEKKNGVTQVYIRRKDGGRFFGSHTVVRADVNQALSTGELQLL
ncbi:hypothetical protein NQT66_07535 [Cellulophaga baltica]|uniref:hypothetical protein n=1 Tax=Cellulophaga baltica TaxID=76594 RepID=UPI0021471F4C|nr:hypothetical protein [Cellulophaga baltica]MCR1024655.1 hypothetical protein [Cellulophaga baltica]